MGSVLTVRYEAFHFFAITAICSGELMLHLRSNNLLHNKEILSAIWRFVGNKLILY